MSRSNEIQTLVADRVSSQVVSGSNLQLPESAFLVYSEFIYKREKGTPVPSVLSLGSPVSLVSVDIFIRASSVVTSLLEIVCELLRASGRESSTVVCD